MLDENEYKVNINYIYVSIDPTTFNRCITSHRYNCLISEESSQQTTNLNFEKIVFYFYLIIIKQNKNLSYKSASAMNYKK